MTFIIFALLSAFACGSDPSAKGKDKILIAVSVHPIYAAVQKICGDRGDVIRAIDPGADPHTFEPAPSSAVKMNRADLCVIISNDFDGWMKKFTSSKTKIIFLAGGQASAGGHSHAGLNPHVWLYPPDMILHMAKVCAALTEISPKDKKYFETRLAAFSAEMKKLDAEIKKILSGIKNRKVIQWHPAWDRFAEGYAIEIAATVESGHGGHLSLKRISESANIAKRNGVRAVILNSKSPSSTADAFVRQIGGAAAMMDQIGGTGERAAYAGLMMYNARTLADALASGETKLNK